MLRQLRLCAAFADEAVLSDGSKRFPPPTLRLSDDDHSWLQLSATTNGVSKSEMVRRCIAMYREDEKRLDEMAAYYNQQ